MWLLAEEGIEGFAKHATRNAPLLNRWFNGKIDQGFVTSQPAQLGGFDVGRKPTAVAGCFHPAPGMELMSDRNLLTDSQFG